MINLMYIVLTAMLALNVSSDVLDGFTQVHEGLNRSNTNFDNRNASILRQLRTLAEMNPDKGGVWYDRAASVRARTAALYDLVDSLKLTIVREADGDDGDVDDIRRGDGLEAAAVVMLNGKGAAGPALRADIDSYREFISEFIADSLKRNTISEALNTDPVVKSGNLVPLKWEEAKFDRQPVVAAVTLLSKLQSDILYAEGEALSALLAQVDAGDVRVNELNAYVMPQSRLVMRGGKYSANIVLAAVDTTQRPDIYIEGRKLDNSNGIYELNTSSTGTFDYSGWLEVTHGDGTVTRHDFESAYTVIEPMATVSATLMNVLYAGIANPIRIAVPGVPSGNVTATMTNGTLVRKGDQWEARPATVGTDAIVSVHAKMADGRSVEMAKTTFRVRALPDPMPFIEYKDQNGNMRKFRGGQFSKRNLVEANGIQAAIDDDLLNVPFKVLSFELTFYDSMGNIIPEVTQGNQFSQRQKDYIRRLARGKRFYITHVKVLGPDNKERIIPTVEVIVN